MCTTRWYYQRDGNKFFFSSKSASTINEVLTRDYSSFGTKGHPRRGIQIFAYSFYKVDRPILVGILGLGNVFLDNASPLSRFDIFINNKMDIPT